MTFSEIESISYVETTLAGARWLFDDEGEGELLSNATPDTRAWVIVAYGRFRKGRDAKVTVTTAQALVIESDTYVGGHTSNARYDLGSVGTEVVIPVGQFPEIDAVRVGAPPRPRFIPRPLVSLSPPTPQTLVVGEMAELFISVAEVPSEYSGYQWQLQWENGVLDFVSASENTAGHRASLCAPASTTTATNGVRPGIEWVGQGAGCLLTTGTTTFEGELTHVTVRCAAPGIAEISLVGPAYDFEYGTMLIAPGGPMEAAIGSPVTVTCTDP